MAAPISIYLEFGAKRTFAGALEWPGWCRSGRIEAAALEALSAYAPRYLAAVGPGSGFVAPDSPTALAVVQRLSGDAGTDFGVPSVPPSADATTIEGPELERWLDVMEAAWEAFERAACAAGEVPLTVGPRGGGRQTAAIREHVLGAEEGYLNRLGRSRGWPEGADGLDPRQLVRRCVMARARGETPPPGRRTAPLWSVRSFIRRATWHVLDHAWEIEDRTVG